jgi:hypothetical protein
LALVLIATGILSCSKDDDFTKPENLSGTTWKCTSGDEWDEDLEYALLVFISTTEVEGWTKEIGEEEEKDWTGTYSITNDKISVEFDEESFTGVINGKKMDTLIEGNSFLFIKQD